jgi:hypothetical protein
MSHCQIKWSKVSIIWGVSQILKRELVIAKVDGFGEKEVRIGIAYIINVEIECLSPTLWWFCVRDPI